MSTFDYLFLAHLVGDFLFQNSWMAGNKSQRLMPLILHAAVYTLIIIITGVAFEIELSSLGIIIIFVSHMVIDQRLVVNWWLRVVMQVSKDEKKWLVIVVDQTIHLLILAIVATC